MKRQKTPPRIPVIIAQTPEELADAEAMATAHVGPVVIVTAKDARKKEHRL
ncbi:MAG TPA: hypothetical protein PK036_14870 [Geobacteraceae bacterium]|nr:hypothetical protein [Geobacteraceae bacterium]